MKANPKTIKGRRALWSQLSDKFALWIPMTDEQLKAEAQKLFPGITIIPTRDECLKLLVMDHTSKMIGDTL